MLELARLSDRESINAMAREVHAMHVAWRPDIYDMPEELYPAQRIAEGIRNRCLYVAKIDGLIVGYVSLRVREMAGPGLVSRKIMLVEELCVEEAVRNQGIGSEIMAEVRILAKAFGCTDLQLSVYPQNDAAVAFYQKCGFMIQSISMQRKV